MTPLDKEQIDGLVSALLFYTHCKPTKHHPYLRLMRDAIEIALNFPFTCLRTWRLTGTSAV